MSFKLVTVVTGAIALSVAAASAIAGQQEEVADWETKVEAKFVEIDTDKDGAVSEQEYLAYKTAEALAQFASMGGEDGSVTLAEAKEAYLASVQEEAPMEDKEAMVDDAEKADTDTE